MNQILVTEKLYITQELKNKKRIYKIEFFVSIFLVFLLSSYYIYAEYDRDKSEEVSQVILYELKGDDNTTRTPNKNNPIIIVVNEEENNIENEMKNENNDSKEIKVEGVTYTAEAFITIPKIGISYPVLSETSDKLLEISVNKFHPEYLKPNEVGNYCIVGHNYRNGKMFGRLSELENGDRVELEDMKGRRVEYQVYNKYVVNPTDTSCTSQLMANGKK